MAEASPELLTPAEASALLGIVTERLAAWADSGKIWCAKTPGGHRRYSAFEIWGIRAGVHTQVHTEIRTEDMK
jgi:putative resolvase